MDGSSTTGNPVVDLAVVVLLILIGGFFAASEIALITVKRHRLTQLAEDGSRSAQTAQRLVEDPSRFLATIQIAITFLGFLAGAVGAVAFSDALADVIRLIPIGFIASAADTIAFVVVTLVIALASIVVGELVPKTLALNFPERLALGVAAPISFIQGLLRPIVWFVTRISAVLVRLLGGKEKPQGGYLSTEELKLLVETGSEQGGFEESLDNIVGILYAKDLLPYLKGNGRSNGTIDIRSLVRPPVYVPESKPVDDLLHEMQVQKRHIAIVVDEYGGTAGLVTLEDVVEEIVGEIQDEYDTEEPMLEDVSTDEELAWRLDGRVSMDDLRDLFDLSDDDEPDEDAYDTVGGFVVHRVGRIPLPGAEVQFRDGVRIMVESAEPRRVAKVIVSRERREEDGNGDEEPIETE